MGRSGVVCGKLAIHFGEQITDIAPAVQNAANLLQHLAPLGGGFKRIMAGEGRFEFAVANRGIATSANSEIITITMSISGSVNPGRAADRVRRRPANFRKDRRDMRRETARTRLVDPPGGLR